MLFKKTLLAAALLAAGSMGSTAMAASPATAQFQVTLTVVAACTVNTPTDIALGTVATGSATSPNGRTTINVTCPDTINYTVGLMPTNTGATANGTGVLRGSAGSSNTIPYGLYEDTKFTQPWGNTAGTNTQAGTGNGKAQSYTAYAQVKSSALASAAADSYSDVVTVNVNF